MKKLLAILIVVLSITSCNDQPSHTAEWSSDGKDSVVKVHYVGQDGSTNDFFMNYLFNSGGYPSVYNHYNSHRSDFDNSRYSTYKERVISSPSRSYSSPSRSSSRSYSSPSRSYSSPSRSYSSPSRSYSSPRTYSSPKSYSSPSRRH